MIRSGWRTVNRTVWTSVVIIIATTGGLLRADLINHWKFDETNGVTTAVDSAGGLNVTLHGNANFIIDDTRGRVLDLGGTINDYADNPGEPFTTVIDHTVAVWVNHHDSGIFSGLWLSWGILGGGRFLLGPHELNDGKIVVCLSDAASVKFADSNAVTVPDSWEYWAFVREGAELRLYLNGEIIQVLTNNITGVIGTASGLQIGRSYTTTAAPLDGRMDDLAIWNEPLTQEQIQAAMALGAEKYNESILINHWKFNETNGVTAVDSAGALPVTLENGAAFVTDATRGQVLELDGVDDLATNSGEPFTNDMTHTVALWTRHDDTPPFSAAWLTWGVTSPSYARYYIFPYEAYSGGVVFSVGDNSMTLFSSAEAVPISGEWQYWTLVRNLKEKTAQLYLNGILIQTLQYINDGGAISTNGILRIGAGLNINNPFSFDGRIDDIAIWQKALTLAEIRSAMLLGAENFRQPLQIPVELIHNWKFNENAGVTEASDSAGNLPATLLNGAVITNDTTRGRVLELDGVNDYANNSDGVPMILDMNHSVAVWVKHHENGSFTGIWLGWGDPDARYFLGPHSVNGGKVIYGMGEDSLQSFSVSGAAPVVDTWQHWAFVREGREARLYLNGVLIQTSRKDNGNEILLGDGLWIGRSFNETTYLDGRMDDLAIWQGVLTVDQIQNVMNYGAQYYLGPPAGTLIMIQ